MNDQVLWNAETLADVTDRDFLGRERERLQADADRIKIQIDEAKDRLRDQDEYASAEWYRSAQHALRIKNRQVQSINRRLGELRRTKHESHAQRFIDAAKRRLQPEVFEEILAEAMEE